MRELDKISNDLFDKIRSRFENVSIGDEKAAAVSDPEKARFFNFDYVDRNGKNYGNVTASLIDSQSLKIYFSKNIANELEPEEQDEWFEFLRGMRKFAKRNLLSFDTRDINRSNLKVRDLQQVSKSDGSYKTNEVDLAESKLYGSTRSSYQTMGPVRLIVRHSNNIDETIHGARTRNIEAIFVETHIGERFLLPFKKLTPARAMARHISEGGNIQDEIGQHMVAMVNEMSDLGLFVRKMRNRTFEDHETTGMIEASIERYNQLHNQLTNMRGSKGYRAFAENFVPDNTIMENDFDIDALKERFVQRIFDDRLSEALPHVYRAYVNKKHAMENNYIAEIENWASHMVEGTWATPESDEDKQELKRIMEKPIEAGVDGDNASAVFYQLIGSDSLFDEFYEISKSEKGPEADVRPLVIEWLKEHGYEEMSAEFNQLLQTQQPVDATVPQPGQLTPQANQATPQSPTAVNQPPTGVQSAKAPTESVDHIVRLAGLRGLRRL
jgi:hypothetical protein